VNFGELVSEVKLKVKTADADVLSMIPTYVQNSIRLIAERFDLPTLKRLGSAETIVGQAWTAMPSNFSGRLTYCGTANGKVNIMEEGFDALLEKYPALDESGDVVDVALLGSVLYYQPIPSEITTLTIIFFADPFIPTENTHIPSDIPIALHGEVIVPKAASMVFDKIESGDKELKKNYNECLAEYEDGLVKLAIWIEKRRGSVSRSFWNA
jgi:hypothetical protein